MGAPAASELPNGAASREPVAKGSVPLPSLAPEQSGPTDAPAAAESRAQADDTPTRRRRGALARCLTGRRAYRSFTVEEMKRRYLRMLVLVRLLRVRRRFARHVSAEAYASLVLEMHALGWLIALREKSGKAKRRAWVLRRQAELRVFVTSTPFELLSLLFILVNTALIVAQAAFPSRQGSRYYQLGELAQVGCGLVFLLELALRMLAFGPRFFAHFWNLLDLLLILVTLVEWAFIVVLTFQLQARAYTGSRFAGVLALRVARVFRAHRVLRSLRLVDRFPALRAVSDALRRASAAVLWVVLLLVLLLVTYGAAAHLLFSSVAASSPPLDDERWGSLGRAVLSLCHVLTLDHGVDVVRELLEASPSPQWTVLIVAFFASFAVLGAYVAFGVIVAVLVAQLEEISRARARAKEHAWFFRNAGVAPPEDVRGAIYRPRGAPRGGGYYYYDGRAERGAERGAARGAERAERMARLSSSESQLSAMSASTLNSHETSALESPRGESRREPRDSTQSDASAAERGAERAGAQEDCARLSRRVESIARAHHELHREVIALTRTVDDMGEGLSRQLRRVITMLEVGQSAAEMRKHIAEAYGGTAEPPPAAPGEIGGSVVPGPGVRRASMVAATQRSSALPNADVLAAVRRASLAGTASLTKAGNSFSLLAERAKARREQNAQERRDAELLESCGGAAGGAPAASPFKSSLRLTPRATSTDGPASARSVCFGENEVRESEGAGAGADAASAPAVPRVNLSDIAMAEPLPPGRRASPPPSPGGRKPRDSGWKDRMSRESFWELDEQGMSTARLSARERDDSQLSARDRPAADERRGSNAGGKQDDWAAAARRTPAAAAASRPRDDRRGSNANKVDDWAGGSQPAPAEPAADGSTRRASNSHKVDDWAAPPKPTTAAAAVTDGSRRGSSSRAKVDDFDEYEEEDEDASAAEPSRRPSADARRGSSSRKVDDFAAYEPEQSGSAAGSRRGSAAPAGGRRGSTAAPKVDDFGAYEPEPESPAGSRRGSANPGSRRASTAAPPKVDDWAAPPKPAPANPAANRRASNANKVDDWAAPPKPAPANPAANRRASNANKVDDWAAPPKPAPANPAANRRASNANKVDDWATESKPAPPKPGRRGSTAQAVDYWERRTSVVAGAQPGAGARRASLAQKVDDWASASKPTDNAADHDDGGELSA